MNKTKVVLLGTGNPNPDPNHSGPSLIVLVGETPYIVDFGAGLIRQAAALTSQYGGPLKELRIENLKTAFLTHMHSDHNIGYADLILTPWIMGRDTPLTVFGPEGIVEMTDYILKAYSDDIKYRLFGSEPVNNTGWKVITNQISEGNIFKDDLVKVEAFLVRHGTWPNAYGFRFITPDKVIVISGDTTPCDNLIAYGQDADILIHEVYSKKYFDQKDITWKNYHTNNHTSTIQLARLANTLKPKLLVLTHTLFWGASEQDILDEISETYQGRIVVGSDLDIFE